jgi:hypothetical protein
VRELEENAGGPKARRRRVRVNAIDTFRNSKARRAIDFQANRKLAPAARALG